MMCVCTIGRLRVGKGVGEERESGEGEGEGKRRRNGVFVQLSFAERKVFLASPTDGDSILHSPIDSQIQCCSSGW